MDSLRMTLILIGLVILVLIWMLHKPNGRSRKPGATRRDAVRQEPPDLESAKRGEDTADRGEDGENSAMQDGDGPPAEPKQTQLPDMGSEAPDWSIESARRSDAQRVRRAAAPDVGSDDEFDDEFDVEEPSATPTSSPSRREPRIEPELPKAAATESERLEPRLEPTWPGDERDSSASGEAPRGRSTPAEQDNNSRIVTLYLRARGERLISGLSLLDSAIKAGLRFGEMKIFHRRHQGATKPVFSMANIARPGSFDPSGWNLFETQGVTLFMTLPGPVSGLDGWDAMLATGQRLAELLDADLMDDSQCLLTRQRIAQIREDMREYDRKADLAR